MKFAMEDQTLARLGQRTQTESDDLGALVRQLIDAAEPLAGQFNGPARATFDGFKARTDEVAAQLNAALVGIVGSISGQSRAFATAAQEGADVHASAEGSADFSSADVLARIAPQA